MNELVALDDLLTFSKKFVVTARGIVDTGKEKLDLAFNEFSGEKPKRYDNGEFYIMPVYEFNRVDNGKIYRRIAPEIRDSDLTRCLVKIPRKRPTLMQVSFLYQVKVHTEPYQLATLREIRKRYRDLYEQIMNYHAKEEKIKKGFYE